MTHEEKFQRSQQQAEVLKSIQTMVMILDVEHLREALKEMRSQNSFRDSALILSPNPIFQMAMNELNELKTKQLSLYVQLADNLRAIANEESKVRQAREQSNDLSRLFGTFPNR